MHTSVFASEAVLQMRRVCLDNCQAALGQPPQVQPQRESETLASLCAQKAGLWPEGRALTFDTGLGSHHQNQRTTSDGPAINPHHMVY